MDANLKAAVEAHLSSQNSSAGIALLQSHLDTHPGCGMSWLALSMFQEQAGMYDEALSSVNKACHVEPGVAEFRVALATALFNAGHHSEAATQMQIGLDLEPENVNFLHAKAQMVSPEEGLTLIEHALRLDATQYTSWVLRGGLLLKLGRLKEAKETANYLCQAAAQAVDSWIMMARVQLVAGEHAEALRSVEKALKIEPKHPEPHRLLDEIQAQTSPSNPSNSYRVQASLQSSNGDPVFLRSELERISMTIFAPDAKAAERLALQGYIQALERAGHQVRGTTVDGQYQILVESCGEVHIPPSL